MSSISNNLPELETIWSLADKNDFKSVIELLSRAGAAENDMGELLFSYGDQAFSQKRFHTAIVIFIFLTDALEDKEEALPLFKRIGDIYSLISEHGKAREYYGRLPITLKNIKLCFQTFVPLLDIDGLLSLRNMIISMVPETNHNQIHTMVDDIIMSISEDTEIFESHLHTYKQNINTLGKIPSFTSDPTRIQQNITSKTALSWKPDILRLYNIIYIKRNGIWHKLFSHQQQTGLTSEKLRGRGIIMFFCNSQESLFYFIDKIQTDKPEFIKKECRVIIDFTLLQTILNVYDLSPLNNCDFIIRFIDQNNLEAQLINLMLEKKLPGTNTFIYLSEGDDSFFSKQVFPILKKCEKKILHNVEQYEQQLAKLFPDSFHKEVINKIQTGKQLRVLLYASRFTTYLQYSIRDIAEGFRLIGHKTFIQIEDDDAGVGIRKEMFLKNLVDFKPDILFEINHFRHECYWIPKSIPFITWVQDLMPHIINLNKSSLITNCDYIFSFSQHWIDHIFKAHPILKNKKIQCLPITASNNIYYPLPSCKKKYDITFISHLPDPALTFLPIRDGIKIPEIKSNSDAIFIRQLIDDLDDISITQLFQIQAKDPARKKFVMKICHKLNIPLSDEVLKLTKPLDDNKVISRFSRHVFMLMKTKPVEVLVKSDYEIMVFGRNWNKYSLFKNIAMGIIKNGKALNRIINESRINLNLSPGTSYHMKAPEVIATNSFMLTRRLPQLYDTMPITNFFKEGSEIIMFDDELDLIKKTCFYLKNKQKRESIAAKAYHKFIDSYGIQKSAQSILNNLVISNEIIKTKEAGN